MGGRKQREKKTRFPIVKDTVATRSTIVIVSGENSSFPKTLPITAVDKLVLRFPVRGHTDRDNRTRLRPVRSVPIHNITLSPWRGGHRLRAAVQTKFGTGKFIGPFVHSSLQTHTHTLFARYACTRACVCVCVTRARGVLELLNESENTTRNSGRTDGKMWKRDKTNKVQLSLSLSRSFPLHVPHHHHH